MRRLAVWSVLCVLAPATVMGQELPQKYALVIGIDEYLFQRNVAGEGAVIPKLKFAVRDVDHLTKQLEKQGYHVTPLRNIDASRRGVIEQLLRHAEIVREEDTFILYYAGHGVRRPKTGTVYWLLYNGEPTYPDVEGMRVSWLIELVNEIPARRKLVLLDHCYAGQLQELPIDVAADATSSARASGEPAASRLVRSRDALPEEMEDVINEQASGMAVIAASRGLAREVAEDQHGVFTAALLSAITTPKADRDQKDGNLSIGEIIDYLFEDVQRRSRANNFEQTPVSQVASANQSEMRAFNVLMRSLEVDEIPAAAQRYRTQLGQWFSQGKISQQVLADCEGVISRWEQTPELLGPTDEKIVFLLRQHIDARPAAEDARIAAELARNVDYHRGL